MHAGWLLLAVIFQGCTHLPFDDGCPSEMVLVDSPDEGIRVCVDRFEYTVGDPDDFPSSYPVSNLNYYQCRALCQRYGYRLLKHREWLEACRGTNPLQCNVFRDHPILRLKMRPQAWRFRGRNCKAPGNMWGGCMQDPKINRQRGSLARNHQFPGCVSQYGVFHMVGNLGEWVDNNRWRRNRYVGQFNGGLYPQPLSTCFYRTVAHGPRYRDYSIGCRCGKDPD